MEDRLINGTIIPSNLASQESVDRANVKVNWMVPKLLS